MPETQTDSPQIPAHAPNEMWEEVAWLPCTLSVELSVSRFTVRDLLQLSVNSVLDARWSKSADVPLRANAELIGWAEFEVVGERLAVRITELA